VPIPEGSRLGAENVENIGLTEAIEALRQELTAAIAAASAKELRFKVGEVSMEFEVGIERVTTGKGGIRFWVLEVGGERSVSTVRTHRLTVPLTPVGGDGNPVMTGEVAIPD
jgi:Trypsin-co-occurring domain 2